MGDIISIILLTFLSLFILMALLNKWLPKSIGCDMLHWHMAPTEQGFDGASFNGICPRCGKRVLQDSQGNWF